MPVQATGNSTGFGAQGHAEAAWAKLHTPGESAAARGEAIDAFVAACRAIEERGPGAALKLAASAAVADPALSARGTAAARILAEVGTTEAVTALLQIAMLPDIEVASRALETLPSMRVSQAAQTMLADAVRAPASGTEAHRRGLLADGLARQLVTGDDFDATAWCAEHPSPNVRAAWARGAGRVGGGTATKHLPPLTEDPDVAVRCWAAFGLALTGDLSALTVLERAAQSRNAGERAAAIGLLGVLPLPHALPPVIAATRDRSPVVARAAIVRAGQLGARESLLAIAEQLDHRRTDIVEQATWALRDLLGSDPGFAWAGRRLSTASAAVVRARCRATGELWAPETRYLLGRPLTAHATAAALDGASGRDLQVAYFTLSGMSGCSFGYDAGADEVANRRPIRKLREWAAEHGRGLLPGAFYFRGERVSLWRH